MPRSTFAARTLKVKRFRVLLLFAHSAGVYKGRKPSRSPVQVAEIRERVVAGEKKSLAGG